MDHQSIWILTFLGLNFHSVNWLPSFLIIWIVLIFSLGVFSLALNNINNFIPNIWMSSSICIAMSCFIKDFITRVLALITWNHSLKYFSVKKVNSLVAYLSIVENKLLQWRHWLTISFIFTIKSSVPGRWCLWRELNALQQLPKSNWNTRFIFESVWSRGCFHSLLPPMFDSTSQKIVLPDSGMFHVSNNARISSAFSKV